MGVGIDDRPTHRDAHAHLGVSGPQGPDLLEIAVDDSRCFGDVSETCLFMRQVRSLDHLGYEATRTRLRLHHDDGMKPPAATELLRARGNSIASWALPVGP